MILKLSDHFGVDSDKFENLGVFDAFVDIDTTLFVDPHLLKQTEIPEFKDSHLKLEKYFSDVIRLLLLSNEMFDLPWQVAWKRLILRELKGVSIGLGKSTGDGSGIGKKLAKKLTVHAKKLIDLGVQDPEIFELIGLFTEDFGPDRLSDMTVMIIREDLYKYTARVASELNIPTVSIKIKEQEYQIPRHPRGNKPVVFLPKELLRTIPVAKNPEDIDSIVHFNEELRIRYNSIVAKLAKDLATMRATKRKEFIYQEFFADPENIKIFVKGYRDYQAKPYDFDSDPQGQMSWDTAGKQFSHTYPLELKLSKEPTIEDIEETVTKIIAQFRKNIEFNGLNIFLYKDGSKGTRPYHERYSQLLFYSIADAYCEANNIDLNREPNPGIGSIDFKFSRGYLLKFIVEIKLSKHKHLLDGYTFQLDRYQKSENNSRGAYLVIQVANSDKLRELKQLEKKAIETNSLAPKIHLVDGRIKPTASKFFADFP